MTFNGPFVTGDVATVWSSEATEEQTAAGPFRERPRHFAGEYGQHLPESASIESKC